MDNNNTFSSLDKAFGTFYERIDGNWLGVIVKIWSGIMTWLIIGALLSNFIHIFGFILSFFITGWLGNKIDDRYGLPARMRASSRWMDAVLKGEVLPEDKPKLIKQKKGWVKPVDVKMVDELNIILMPDVLSHFFYKDPISHESMVKSYNKENNIVKEFLEDDGKLLFTKLLNDEDFVDCDWWRTKIDRDMEDPNTFYFIEPDGNLYKSQSEKYRKRDIVAEHIRREQKHKLFWKKQIKELLLKESKKLTCSDINAHLKLKYLEFVKDLCKEMYENGEIDFAGNSRYFILSEKDNSSKSKKNSAPKSEEVDVKAELKKYKEMLDDGLITQEQYDAKSNELLGL